MVTSVEVRKAFYEEEDEASVERPKSLLGQKVWCYKHIQDQNA